MSKSEHTYWHQAQVKKSKNFVYLPVLLVLVLVVGGFYYFSGSSTSTNKYKRPETNIVEGIVQKTEGYSLNEIKGEGVLTTVYKVDRLTRDEVIANTTQFLTNSGWTIRAGTELKGGQIYMISAFDPETNQNLQVNISTQQEARHTVSIIYPEA